MTEVAVEAHEVSRSDQGDGTIKTVWSDGSVRMIEANPGREIVTSDDSFSAELNPPTPDTDWEAVARAQMNHTEGWKQSYEGSQVEVQQLRQQIATMQASPQVVLSPKLVVAIQMLQEELQKMGLSA